MKTHTLKFKGYHGRPKKIAEIRDLNEAGQPKSDHDILDEAFLLIHAFCAERNFKIYYTRTWNHNGVTFLLIICVILSVRGFVRTSGISKSFGKSWVMLILKLP